MRTAKVYWLKIMAKYRDFRRHRMENGLRPVMTLRLFREEKCFGPGVARLLALVEETSSLRAAAQSMDMAYSKAWSIVKNSERGLGFKLLASTTGGKGGGGAQLTPEARKLMRDFSEFEKETKTNAERLFLKYFGEYK
jgi:molybdate transport system regulatory protein